MQKVFKMLILLSLLILIGGVSCFNADGLGVDPPVADTGGETSGDGGTSDDASTTDEGGTPGDDTATEDVESTDTPAQDT